MLVSGMPPIRASKLKYYADRNFLARRLPAPSTTGPPGDAPPPRGDDWCGQHARRRTRASSRPWSELVAAARDARPRTRPSCEPAPATQPDWQRDLATAA